MASKDRVFANGGDVALAPPPSAGAYYGVKNQALPPPATYQGRRGGRNPCRCLLVSLFSILTIAAVALGIAVLVYWIVVQPRDPEYYVDSVQISGLPASGSSTSDTNATFQIQARNPNKHIGFYYDHIDVNVETQGVEIGGTNNIKSFYQGHKNTTIINAEMPVNGDTLVSSADTTRVQLYVKVDVKSRFKVGSWKLKSGTRKIRCNVVVDLTKSDTSNYFVSSACKIDRIRKIWF